MILSGERRTCADADDDDDDDEIKPKPIPSAKSSKSQENVRIAYELEQAEARNAEREGRIIRETAPAEETPAKPVPQPVAKAIQPPSIGPDAPHYTRHDEGDGIIEVRCEICHAMAEQTGLNVLRKSYRNMAALASHLYLKHQIHVPLPDLCEFQERGPE